MDDGASAPRARGLRRVFAKVDRSGAPAYAQIEDRVAEAIVAGDFRSGDRLPPERELSQRLGVSRMTLRQALQALERRGMVRRAVGRRGGTFIAEPKIERDVAVAGLTEQLRRQGHRAGASVLSVQEGPSSGRTATALGLEPGVNVFEVVRLRLSDEVPLALERSLFPADRFAGLLELPLDGSLYALLERAYEVSVRRAVERLEPVIAGPREAALLAVGAGAPLLLVERTAFDAHGTPVEYARDLFRGDRTQVVVESNLEPSPEP